MYSESFMPFNLYKLNLSIMITHFHIIDIPIEFCNSILKIYNIPI